MTRSVLNLVAFQAGWLSCVLGAANGYPLLGPVVVLGIVAVHLAAAVRPSRELTLIALAGLLGAAFDTALVQSGWLNYANGMLWAGTAPYWIVAMWLSFATTLNVSLRWLRGRPWLAAGFGAVGAPLSYLAGESLGALEVASRGAALASLSAGWALSMPLLVVLARKLDGVRCCRISVRQYA